MTDIKNKYSDLKAQGFRFGVRPHLAQQATDLDQPDEIMGLHHLSDVFDVTYIKKWSDDNRTVCVGIVGGRPPEHLVMAFLEDGNKWIAGYLVDLTEYE